jgi:hypothetical protein
VEDKLKYVWNLRDEASCWRVAHLWHLKLSAEDRALASITALLSLEPEQAIETAQFVLNAMSRGQPGPPLISYKDEAKFWAGNTHPDELAQYLRPVSGKCQSSIK